ncbi:MAG TPA: hypothetical protein VFS23_21700, partial [Vicinamibacterales bacterium]|nr:hypothetical protein [Vicinamibacterales bacterium]
MPPDGFLRDEWFIAIISLLIVPITEVLVRKVRSIFGIYSGQYAALTYSEGSGKVLVEDVRCRHIG